MLKLGCFGKDFVKVLLKFSNIESELQTMRKATLLLLFLLPLGLCVQAQDFSTTNKKALKLYADAMKAKKDRDFDKAIGNLEKAVKADPNFAEAYQELGVFHTILRDNSKARMYFEKAVEVQPNSNTILVAYLEVANFKLAEGDYEGANALVEKYLGLNPPARLFAQTRRAKQVQSICAYALEGMKNPVDFKPVELTALNELEHQFFPVLTADQQTMIFTGLTEKGDENMFMSTKNEEGTWTEPQPIKELNTVYNEGTCSISADGKTIIFTSCEGAGNKRQIYGSCDLFISKKVGGVWSPPRNIGGTVNSKYWESQPALSGDGQTLYFSSNRPGGKGKRDIWMSTIDANGRWTRPQCLNINTGGNEYSPFIHVNGKSLFFSSDGYGGYGRLDLFQSELDETGKWGTPKNLGYPINNSGDQAALFITADGLKGYYSDGIMKDGKRVKDLLNVFDIPKEIQIEDVSDVVKGVVYDAKTKKKLEAKINLVDLATEKVVTSATSDIQDGDYLITLTSGSEYALYVNKEGYLFKSMSFNYKEKKEAQTIEVDVYLEPIEKGSKVTLNNIFFASGSYELEDKSKTELNKLVKFMKENKDTKIEVGAHTDDVGSTDSNQKLSLKRAESVTKYLQENGIAAERVISFGYGESQPIETNETDEGKAKNRRIEFKIL